MSGFDYVRAVFVVCQFLFCCFLIMRANRAARDVQTLQELAEVVYCCMLAVTSVLMCVGGMLL